MPASSKQKYSKTLAFPNAYYESFSNLGQSVELFCAYIIVTIPADFRKIRYPNWNTQQFHLYRSSLDFAQFFQYFYHTIKSTLMYSFSLSVFHTYPYIFCNIHLCTNQFFINSAILLLT